MIKIENLNKKFKNKLVIDNFSLELTDGVYGLLGPNGAGKTTLMRLILGIYKTNSIEFDNINKNEMGYLSQKFGAFKELTVYEFLNYFCNLKNIKNSDEAIKNSLDLVNLSEKISNKIKTLSGGMIRRVGIAQAILGNPKLIIFDEPTVGLDPEERLRFKNLINKIKENKIILISTHIVEDVDIVCDKIIVMNEGKLLASGTRDFIANQATNKVFELDFCLQEDSLTNFFTIKSYEKEGKCINRIISRNNLNLPIVKPTIEDGYLCLLKNI